jgi:O-antigen/teichoic acid export membrane protein
MAYKNNPPLKEKINKAEKRKILFFLAPISATVLSGLFFGYIDIIMLGRFVDSEYLGYYQAALALIGSAGAFVGFMSAAIFPLFSQLKGRQLTTLFNKSMKYTMIFSLIGVVGTLVFSKLIITLIYGPRYLLSIPLLNLFSFILVLDPLIGLYSSFFISQDKQNFIAKIFLFSTILNIILNYFFITLFLKNGSYFATIGAAIATIISKSICLSILSFKK